MLTKLDVKSCFQSMGLTLGEIVLIHSSFKALGKVEGGPQTLVQAALECVGDTGTVLFPTFNFASWSESHYFDLFHTPSTMGAITETARKDPRFKRTRHPIYSWVVAGALQDQFVAIDSENCFGSESLFEVLHQKNALILSLGLDFNNTFSMTHHAEKMSGACSYRHDKPFSGIYVGYDRRPTLKTYSMFVRDVSQGVETYIVPAVEKMVGEGIVNVHEMGLAKCHSVKAQKYLSSLIEIVKSNPEMLHRKKA